MKKQYCPYCGNPLENGCHCEEEAEREHEERIEELEERQHASGFYAFQDLLEMYKSER